MENEKRGSNEKVEKTTQKLLTEQDPYNIITQCDVVRNAFQPIAQAKVFISGFGHFRGFSTGVSI